MENEEQEKKPAARKPRRLLGVLRGLGVTVASLVLLVTAVVGLLYVPGVLNRVATWVLPSVEEASGLRISAEDIRLRWPLRLSLERALVLDMKAGGDTMVAARSASVAVNPLTLMRGHIGISNAEIRDGFYQMGGADSLYISVNVDSIGAAATLAMDFSDIDVDHADLDGARVLLLMGPDTTETPKDTTATAPMTITAGPITMRNVDYRMSMALTNDTIAARLRDAALSGGRLLIADTIDILTGRLTMAVDSALYGTRGAIPVAGLDQNWLTLRKASARVDSFAMHGTRLSVPLKELRVGEVAGMPLEASGLFAMTDSALSAKGFDIALNERTRLRLDAEMGMGDMASAPVNVDASADVYTAAVIKALPAYAPLLAPLPADKPLRLRAVATGTLHDLDIDTIAASMAGVFAVKGGGTARNITDPKTLELDATITGRLINARPLASMLPKGVNLPPLTLKGRARARGNNYAASLTATTGAGRLALNGTLAGTAPRYGIDLRADSFPVAAFMPDLGIGAVSGTVKANGAYFNPLKRGAAIDAQVDLRSLENRGRHIGHITLDARLADGNIAARLDSRASDADLSLDLTGRLEPKTVSWNLAGNVRELDLRALGLTDSVMNGRLALTSEGFAAINLDTIRATATLRDALLHISSNTLRLDSLTLSADAGRRTSVTLGNRTLTADFRADTTLTALAGSFGNAATTATSMIEKRDLQADSLVRLLPPFALDVSALSGNALAQYLEPTGIGFRTLNLKARGDTTLYARAEVIGLTSGKSLTIDTIDAKMATHRNALWLDIDLDNRPGTLDEFAHVCLKGRFAGHDGKFFLQQRNLQGLTGYRLGLQANVTDSLIAINLTPTEPTIAYKKWTVNKDNYIAFNPHNYHIHANLDARGDGSRIQLLTSAHEDNDSVDAPNDIALKISDIHIQDWLKINPFAPPIAGDVNADLTLTYTDKTVNGRGTASLLNLTYGKQPVGNFDLDLDVNTDFGGSIRADAALNVNGARAMTATGALNDTTARSPLALDLKVTSFPLSVANPFLPKEYASLSGALDGLMAVSGTFKDMRLDGRLNFADARVDVGMMGSSFRFDSTAIAVDSSIVRFNDFAIFGSNSNPLKVNGSVDIRDFASPRIDLGLTAKNMQFLNSRKAKNVNLYGRGFINLDATARGTLSFMRVNADLAILSQTNLTYQVTSAKAVVGMQPDEDVVKFVNFADTAQVVQADSVAPSGMMMILDANVDIRQGAQFTVDLSTDGQNRANLRAQGNLNYSMSPTQPDGRLTGRLVIDGGFFRYSLPVISEKLFTFIPGSYVAFNGPVLNPTLHISASDQVRANVTRTGENSRLVNFDVSLAATGTLEHLDVAFDLSTNDDISVQNELQAMSPTQRANQAMNLLLYGIYSSGNTSATANLSGNALYGFLSSQLNKWAASTIKGVDVSFGFDQFDRTRNGTTSTATQYSYKVSKSLFNDKFKIVVGGNYSTDTEEADIAENLISDVSFEYMLNDSGSMYVRLFRHTGYESILEGEVTQTGVGFVVRRKINRLADIFNFIKAAKQ